jgi:chemotaxis protein CheX
MSVVAPAPIDTESIDKSIARAISNVFGVMLHRTARFVEKTSVPLPPAAGATHLVIGSVGFVGRMNGIVYLCFPEAFSIAAAAHILGMSENEVEFQGPDVVKDVVGELTNMTVGGFKNTLADLGYPCRLTLPVIMRGHHIAVSSIKSAQRQIYHFESERHRISADIQIMPE